MYIKILIIIALIILGFLLKKTKLLNKGDGEIILTKLVFYIFMPAAVFLSMSRVTISGVLFSLPLTATIIMLVCFGVAWFLLNRRGLENKTRGTAIIAAMTINSSMGLYPIFQLFYGDEGLARAVIFDFAVSIITFSLVYFVAVYYGGSGNNRGKVKESVLKTLKLPAIWAVILGMTLNLSGVTLPVLITDGLDILSKPLIPLLLIAVGLYFEPKLYKPKLLLSVVAIRITIGLLIGILMIWLFRLDGINKLVVLVAATAPAAYNTVVYSVKEKLDEDFAVTAVTATMVLNIIAIAIIFMILA